MALDRMDQSFERTGHDGLAQHRVPGAGHLIQPPAQAVFRLCPHRVLGHLGMFHQFIDHDALDDMDGHKPGVLVVFQSQGFV